MSSSVGLDGNYSAEISWILMKINIWNKIDINMLTISHIQLICSRRYIVNSLSKIRKLSINEKELLKKLKRLWQNEKEFILSNFFFCHNVLNSNVIQKCKKRLHVGKGKCYMWRRTGLFYHRNYLTPTSRRHLKYSRSLLALRNFSRSHTI